MDISTVTLSQEYTAPVYPSKYSKTEEKNSHPWLQTARSLAFYLLIGYYVFQSLEWLLLITAIVIIHEMGHFLAMKAFGYRETGIFFIPLLGAYASGAKREVSQKESAIILLAGPLPGMLLGITFYFLSVANPSLHISFISFERIGLAFLFLNLVNLLPVYPLDGGQLLNRIYLDEEGISSQIFQWMSIAGMVAIALFAFEKPFYLLLIFPALMIYRKLSERKLPKLQAALGNSGIDLNTSYQELSDESYWKLRSIIIEHVPEFRKFHAGPPFVYDDNEEKIVAYMEGLFERYLIYDLSWLSKLLLLIVWVAAITCPWWLHIGEGYLQQLGLKG